MAVRPASAGAFSDDEEEFFRTGETEVVESWDDLDDGYTPPSFWSRLVGRRPVRAATEPPLPVELFVVAHSSRSSRSSIIVEDDEEWEWTIAIARARIAVDNAAS